MSAESRTFHLDNEVVLGLRNSILAKDLIAFDETAQQLPDALSPKELSDLSIQVNLALGGDSTFRSGVERELLFNLGAARLFTEQDIVTAQSAIELLKKRDLMSKIGAAMLWWEKRKMINSLVADIPDTFDTEI